MHILVLEDTIYLIKLKPMSYNEMLKEWEKIFILIMENTDDLIYNKAEEIINKTPNQNLIKEMLEEELPLSCAIGGYIIMMLIESQGPDKLGDLNMEEMVRRIDDFWNRYLKKPTRVFTSKNGLPTIDQDSLKVACKFIKI